MPQVRHLNQERWSRLIRVSSFRCVFVVISTVADLARLSTRTVAIDLTPALFTPTELKGTLGLKPLLTSNFLLLTSAYFCLLFCKQLLTHFRKQKSAGHRTHSRGQISLCPCATAHELISFPHVNPPFGALGLSAQRVSGALPSRADSRCQGRSFLPKNRAKKVHEAHSVLKNFSRFFLAKNRHF